MDAATRDLAARQLAALVQQLQTTAAGLARARLAAEVNALRELLGIAADPSAALLQLTGQEVSASEDPAQVLADARYWFMTRLRDRAPLDSQLGPVRVSKRGSWDEVKRGGKHDTLKLRLLPAVPVLIERGRYHGREPLNKVRDDDFVAFHFFTGWIALPELVVEAGVLIGEDSEGKLLYSVSHDASSAWQKRTALAGEGSRAPSDQGGPGVEQGPTLDAIIAEVGAGLNLSILRVVSRR